MRLLAIILLAATAVPLPKVGACPSGYASEAHWCVPMANAPAAVVKGRGQCPSTMVQSGQYCVEKR
jgi:hypothetical protein